MNPDLCIRFLALAILALLIPTSCKSEAAAAEDSISGAWLGALGKDGQKVGLSIEGANGSYQAQLLAPDFGTGEASVRLNFSEGGVEFTLPPSLGRMGTARFSGQLENGAIVGTFEHPLPGMFRKNVTFTRAKPNEVMALRPRGPATGSTPTQARPRNVAELVELVANGSSRQKSEATRGLAEVGVDAIPTIIRWLESTDGKGRSFLRCGNQPNGTDCYRSRRRHALPPTLGGGIHRGHGAGRVRQSRDASTGSPGLGRPAASKRSGSVCSGDFLQAGHADSMRRRGKREHVAPGPLSETPELGST